MGLTGLQLHASGGAVMNACGVLADPPACNVKQPMPTGGGSLWDFAATACLFQEWGRPFSDIHGDKLELNPEGSTFMNQKGALYATDEVLAEKVKEIYRDFSKRDLTY